MSQLNLIGQLEGNIHRIARSLLPVPIVTRNSYNKSIPRVGQYREIFRSRPGKYSVLDLGIVPPFGRADTVNLEQNISRYCPPSHAIIQCTEQGEAVLFLPACYFFQRAISKIIARFHYRSFILYTNGVLYCIRSSRMIIIKIVRNLSES